MEVKTPKTQTPVEVTTGLGLWIHYLSDLSTRPSLRDVGTLEIKLFAATERMDEDRPAIGAAVCACTA
jgi:hypothetical protein